MSINCKFCGKEIAKRTKKCPHCGGFQKNFYARHKILTGAVILLNTVVWTSLIASMSHSSSQVVKAVSVTQASKSQVEGQTYSDPNLVLAGKVTESTDEYGNVVFTGTVKNIAKQTYSYAEVNIDLYDAQGNQVRSAMDNINNLEPGSTWAFKTIPQDGGFKTYKVVDIWGRN